MDSISDGIKKALLAGVGAAALTFEKSSEIVDALVRKGEITVEQGKSLNQELKHKAEEEKNKAADEKKTEEPEEKKIDDFVSSLSADELEELKKALAEKEEKKDQ